ncbi:MAG: diguanylate cyclase [Methylococcaceae bacterium]|nr:diguanylate cyclase [Methylococcaceae bacterium]
MLQNGDGLEDIIVELLSSLSAIKDLSELNCQAGSEKELITNALSVLIQNQDMERCSFFLLNDLGFLVNLTGLSVMESPDATRKQYKTSQFKVGEGIIGTAALKGELQHCQNCLEDERFASIDKQVGVVAPGSIISVPITVGIELVGVLNISHPQAYHFNDWHIRMLGIYKNMLGQLIANYRLFRQMDDQIFKRTAKLEEALVDLNTLKEHFESISMIDQLTGLYNRRYFYEQSELALANTKRYGQPLCLLVLDLDHFKRVNDQYGHGVGDKVLIKTSKVLQQQIRDTDVLVRYGGEEFVIIFTNTSCSNGKIFAERIRKKIESLKWQDSEYVQTVSIGLYCLSSGCCLQENNKELNIDKLVNFADTALYKAKAEGRNQVVIYNGDKLEK